MGTEVEGVSLCALASPFIWRYQVQLANAGFRVKKVLHLYRPYDHLTYQNTRLCSSILNIESSRLFQRPPLQPQRLPGSKHRIEIAPSTIID